MTPHLPQFQKPRKPSIYVSSRSKHGPMWRALRAAGLPIAATWIDDPGPSDAAGWSGLYGSATTEAARARVNIFYAPASDEPWLGALIEMGATLGAGGVVILVTDDLALFKRWEEHPRVIAVGIDALHTAGVMAMRMIGVIR